MKRLFVLSAAMTTLGFATAAGDITGPGWGGACTQSQIEACHKPFTARTGINVIPADADNPAAPIKAMVGAGNVTVDVAPVDYAAALRLCDKGLLEPIDAATLPPARDGTRAIDDFLPGAVTDCLVSTDVCSTVCACDTTRYPGNPPATVASFFDLEKFPGKRGIRKGAKGKLEMAMLADGVAPADVHALLSTPGSLDRAFARLDTIKAETLWREASTQPPQLPADGEVVMTVAWNGRIFNAALAEGRPFRIVRDGQVCEMEGFVIPKGAPNRDAAMEFIRLATGTGPLAHAAEGISYGPPRKSSAPLVGLYQDGKTEMAPNLPASPGNMTNALASDCGFWVDRDTELNEGFNAWLAAN